MSDKPQQKTHSGEAVKSGSIEKILQELPEDKREIIYSAFYAIERSYSGPLPPPEDFLKYEKALPGAMDRILKLTEKQVDHRIEQEKTELKFESRGQIIGAMLVAMFGILSFLLAMFGHENVAIGLGVTTVVSLAVIFVLNKMPANKENK